MFFVASKLRTIHDQACNQKLFEQIYDPGLILTAKILCVITSHVRDAAFKGANINGGSLPWGTGYKEPINIICKLCYSYIAMPQIFLCPRP